MVEAAIAGVVAGRDGGFGMVIGVARDGDNDALSQAGADLVICSLDELHFGPARLAAATRQGSPSVPECGAGTQDQVSE